MPVFRRTVCARVRVCERVRVCACACVRACVYVRVCVRARWPYDCDVSITWDTATPNTHGHGGPLIQVEFASVL